eukprot:TRINITY_DN31405_c0_g1_i1.p1 TRINITY_DN31405_c0_g1~~TRINITY_DN31405_c0_g1_i1.p1  ORF type:complete len:112 (+),score=32.50 TRINITY_DN31405_c0_g1_i1:48-338(+)
MVPLWRHYYEGTDAVIFVVDSNDNERMEEAKNILETILSDEKLVNTPLLVMSNKMDLPGQEHHRGDKQVVTSTSTGTGSGSYRTPAPPLGRGGGGV